MATVIELRVLVSSNDERPEPEVRDRLQEAVQRALACVFPAGNLFIERVEHVA